MIDSLAKKKMMLQEQWYQRSKQEDQKLNRFGETYHKKKHIILIRQIKCIHLNTQFIYGAIFYLKEP